MIFSTLFKDSEKVKELVKKGRKAMQFGYQKAEHDFSEILRQKSMSPS